MDRTQAIHVAYCIIIDKTQLVNKRGRSLNRIAANWITAKLREQF